MTPLTVDEIAWMWDWPEDMRLAFKGAREVLGNFEVREPFAAWKFQFSLRAGAHGERVGRPVAVLNVDWRSPNRDTGVVGPMNSNRLVFMDTVPLKDVERHVHGLVSQVLRELILHELMESVHYFGRRLWDPHAHESTRGGR